MCRFAGVGTVPAVYASSNRLFCPAPPHPALGHGSERVAVEVSLNGADFSWSGVHFTYNQPLEVLSVSPAFFGSECGTIATLTGKHFHDSGALSCSFGASSVVPALWVSSEAIRCQAPPHPPGVAVVTASINGIDFAVSAVAVQYVLSTRLAALEPAGGPTRGGTLVRVVGTNFVQSPELVCSFESAEGGEDAKVVVVPATFVDATEVACVAPALPQGVAVVEVTANGLDLHDLGNALRVRRRPRRGRALAHLWPRLGWHGRGRRR